MKNLMKRIPKQSELLDFVSNKTEIVFTQLTGQIKSRHTIRGWTKFGLSSYSGKQIYLKYVKLGRYPFTTEKWIEDFIRKVRQ